LGYFSKRGNNFQITQTYFIARFPLKLESKNWLLALAPRARWPRPKMRKLTPWCRHPQKHKIQNSNFLQI